MAWNHAPATVALGASSTAIVVARLLLGDAPDFHVQALAFPVAQKPFVLCPGCFWLGLASRRPQPRNPRCDRKQRTGRAAGSVELCAALIGAAVGMLAWIAPGLVGGGDPITQGTLAGAGTLAKSHLYSPFASDSGVVSYAAATPGGFSPLARVGITTRPAFWTTLPIRIFLVSTFNRTHLLSSGMAAFFLRRCSRTTHRNRAGNGDDWKRHYASSDAGACFAAMLLPTFAQRADDSLRERTVRRFSAFPLTHRQRSRP